MVSEEIVVSTIKRMLDSGIEESVIAKTLKDIGLKESEIKQYLSQVRGPASSSNESASEDAESRQDTQELLHTTTHNKLEEHSEKLDSVQKNVSGLSEKISSITSGPSNRKLLSELALLNQKISGLEKQLSDLKAMNSASKSLLEKILETNKKIVEKL